MKVLKPGDSSHRLMFSLKTIKLALNFIYENWVDLTLR